jgi:hypothetical protein
MKEIMIIPDELYEKIVCDAIYGDEEAQMMQELYTETQWHNYAVWMGWE